MFIFNNQNVYLSIIRLLDILEVIAPYKHFHKLRNFIHMKLPPGFPVKIGKKMKPLSITSPLPPSIEIPMFPTVTAIISLQSYELKQFPPSKFLVPREYTKVSHYYILYQ